MSPVLAWPKAILGSEQPLGLLPMVLDGADTIKRNLQCQLDNGIHFVVMADRGSGRPDGASRKEALHGKVGDSAGYRRVLGCSIRSLGAAPAGAAQSGWITRA